MVLVRLPGQAFENGQTVTVRDSLIERRSGGKQSEATDDSLQRGTVCGVGRRPADHSPGAQAASAYGGAGPSPYDTHSVDLSLGNEITVPRKGQITSPTSTTSRPRSIN